MEFFEIGANRIKLNFILFKKKKYSTVGFEQANFNSQVFFSVCKRNRENEPLCGRWRKRCRTLLNLRGILWERSRGRNEETARRFLDIHLARAHLGDLLDCYDGCIWWWSGLPSQNNTIFLYLCNFHTWVNVPCNKDYPVILSLFCVKKASVFEVSKCDGGIRICRALFNFRF